MIPRYPNITSLSDTLQAQGLDVVSATSSKVVTGSNAKNSVAQVITLDPVTKVAKAMPKTQRWQSLPRWGLRKRS